MGMGEGEGEDEGEREGTSARTCTVAHKNCVMKHCECACGCVHVSISSCLCMCSIFMSLYVLISSCLYVLISSCACLQVRHAHEHRHERLSKPSASALSKPYLVAQCLISRQRPKRPITSRLLPVSRRRRCVSSPRRRRCISSLSISSHITQQPHSSHHTTVSPLAVTSVFKVPFKVPRRCCSLTLLLFFHPNIQIDEIQRRAYRKITRHVIA